jgi:mannose-6-phosphate isomerase-like protein (cupin superfamily)
MKGFKTNIQEHIDQKEGQSSLFKAVNLQLNLLVLKIGDSTEMLTDNDSDLVIKVESGMARIQIGSILYEVAEGDLLIVPVGLKYKIINVDDAHHLRLFIIYAPPPSPVIG